MRQGEFKVRLDTSVFHITSHLSSGSDMNVLLGLTRTSLDNHFRWLSNDLQVTASNFADSGMNIATARVQMAILVLNFELCFRNFQVNLFLKCRVFFFPQRKMKQHYITEPRLELGISF